MTMMKFNFCIFNNGVVCVSQLARIQTDSVASTLKELYPDVHLEIGKWGNFARHNFYEFCQLYLYCIYTHIHTHCFSFSCPHPLTACLRTERDCVVLRMCNLYHRSTAESYCLCQKTWMMMSELEPVCTTIQLLTFLCTCISVAMSTIGDKILDTALSKVEIHLQFHMSLLC